MHFVGSCLLLRRIKNEKWEHRSSEHNVRDVDRKHESAVVLVVGVARQLRDVEEGRVQKCKWSNADLMAHQEIDNYY